MNALIEGARREKLIHIDVLLLTDAIGTVRRLVLHSWIPPTVNVNHHGSPGQSNSCTSGADRKQHDPRPGITLELRHQLRASGPAHRAVELEYGQPILGLDRRRQHPAEGWELREQQHLLALRHGLADELENPFDLR